MAHAKLQWFQIRIANRNQMKPIETEANPTSNSETENFSFSLNRGSLTEHQVGYQFICPVIWLSFDSRMKKEERTHSKYLKSKIKLICFLIAIWILITSKFFIFLSFILFVFRSIFIWFSFSFHLIFASFSSALGPRHSIAEQDEEIFRVHSSPKSGFECLVVFGS